MHERKKPDRTKISLKAIIKFPFISDIQIIEHLCISTVYFYIIPIK